MRRDPRPALHLALACAAGLVVTGLIALLWPPAQARDSAALTGFANLDRGRLTDVATWLVHLCDPRPYAIAGAVLFVAALLRRRWSVAALLPVVLIGAGLTTQLLKPLLATPRGGGWPAAAIESGAWPSGHATAALTLALCATLVAPARWRPAVAAGGAAFAVAVAYGILVLAWHFPSDVLGGFFVAALWVLAAVALLLALERRRPRAAGARGAPPVLWPIGALAAAGAAAGLAALPVAARHGDLVAYAQGHETTMLFGAAIAALAMILAAAVVRAARS